MALIRWAVKRCCSTLTWLPPRAFLHLCAVCRWQVCPVWQQLCAKGVGAAHLMSRQTARVTSDSALLHVQGRTLPLLAP